MAFRNYKTTIPMCIQRDTPSQLDIEIDKVQSEYDIIDLQFSTHCTPLGDQKYCALLLLAKKESK